MNVEIERSILRGRRMGQEQEQSCQRGSLLHGPIIMIAGQECMTKCTPTGSPSPEISSSTRSSICSSLHGRIARPSRAVLFPQWSACLQCVHTVHKSQGSKAKRAGLAAVVDEPAQFLPVSTSSEYPAFRRHR